MEITWYGHSCFRLAERGMATVVTDPFDSREVGYEPLKLKANIVTVSHDAPGNNYITTVKGTLILLRDRMNMKLEKLLLLHPYERSYKPPEGRKQ